MSKHNAQTYQRETCSQKKYQDAGRATGRCQFCPLPAAPGRTLCDKHLLANKQTSKELSAAAAARGDCTMCRKDPATPGKKTCSPCRKRAQARAVRLKAAGVCPDCAVRPVIQGKTRCIECADKARRNSLFSPRSPQSLDGMRQTTLERDGHQCRLCGSSDRILVHHIDGNGVSPAKIANNAPNNLVILCKSCHGWLEGLLRTCADMSLLVRLIQRKPL